MPRCRHPELIEFDNLTAVDINIKGQQGNVIGAFQWKKYTCKKCKCLITILQAVVEKETKTCQTDIIG